SRSRARKARGRPRPPRAAGRGLGAGSHPLLRRPPVVGLAFGLFFRVLPPLASLPEVLGNHLGHLREEEKVLLAEAGRVLPAAFRVLVELGEGHAVARALVGRVLPDGRPHPAQPAFVVWFWF